MIGGEETFDMGRWKLYPDAWKFLAARVKLFMNYHKYVTELAGRIERATSTRFIDWVDHMVLAEEDFDTKVLTDLGFTEVKDERLIQDGRLFRHEGSTIFPIIVRPGGIEELAIRVGHLDSFTKTHATKDPKMGRSHAPFSHVVMARQDYFIFSAVERNGYSGFVVQPETDMNLYEEAVRFFKTRETRKRGLEPVDRLGMLRDLYETVEDRFSGLSRPRLTQAFLRAERAFWLRRNKAGRIQKKRQDNLGLGLANHDHHAFRSSRENMVDLLELLKLIGLEERERFYAGDEAGWGAQVLENAEAGCVVFADVDLLPNEKDVNLAVEPLRQSHKLGTIGIWCALHGDSIFTAGMHHLALRANHAALRSVLPRLKVPVMEPFSYYDHLKQSFTEGDGWMALKKRARSLFEAEQLMNEQFYEVRTYPIMGSHMEIIERNDGYKGFDQDSVDTIIRDTDPRTKLSQY